jgi:ribosome-associated translation inhibitor RaiA
MSDKIDRQVRRLKGRLREHHHVKPERMASNN